MSKEMELHQVRKSMSTEENIPTEESQLAEALVAYETLTIDGVKRVIKGERLRPVDEKLREAIQQAETEVAATSQTRESERLKDGRMPSVDVHPEL